MSTTLVEPRLVGLVAGEGHGQGDVLLGGERRAPGCRPGRRSRPGPGAAAVSSLSLRRAEVDVADEDLARGERVEAGHAVHQRRLARARRAHDRGEAAARRSRR